MHPRLEPSAQLLQDIGDRGLSGEVVGLVRVEDEVVELLGGDGALGLAVCEEDVLARAVVGVREDGARVIVEPPDVLR